VIILDKTDVKFTERMLRVISIAEIEIKKTNCRVLTPVHLFIACIIERTGVLGEISLKCNFDIISLRAMSKEMNNQTLHKPSNESTVFTVPITEEVQKVMKVALGYMKRYSQVYLNEGHLLKALITTSALENYLSNESKDIILSIGTRPRDMITHLREYTFPETNTKNIKKVTRDQYEELVQFLKRHFSENWSNTIKNTLSFDSPPIYIATEEKGDLVGFAAYDVVRGKKGLFGPMGVALNNRVEGIGHSLLHYCLKDMKEVGYEYAIIGEAGPIEFYEKTCNAVLIPVH
jgi:N-acetylglutamate synthase-like GNAT family acetyltransferase